MRSLWESRDELAASRDVAPGRLLPDTAIVDVATREPADKDALVALPVFRGRAQRRLADRWWRAIRAGATLPADELPESSPAGDGPPPVNRWADKDPDAAARVTAARAHLAALSEQWDTPVENLLQPDLVRRLCWTPPEHIDAGSVDAVLAAGGARPWQRELAGPGLLEALHAAAPAAREGAERPARPGGDDPDDAGAAPGGRSRRRRRRGAGQDAGPGPGADRAPGPAAGQLGTVAPVFSDPDG